MKAEFLRLHGRFWLLILWERVHADKPSSMNGEQFALLYAVLLVKISRIFRRQVEQKRIRFSLKTPLG
jgi:hypothetical protein